MNIYLTWSSTEDIKIFCKLSELILVYGQRTGSEYIVMFAGLTFCQYWEVEIALFLKMYCVFLKKPSPFHI